MRKSNSNIYYPDPWFRNDDKTLKLKKNWIKLLIMDELLVSAIIPSYNRYSYLENAISSIENQTYKNIEIIVINDGSDQNEYYSKELANRVNLINLKRKSWTKKDLGMTQSKILE